MTTRLLSIGLLSCCLAACGGGTGTDATSSGGAKGIASMFSSNRTLASGTSIEVTIRDPITSRQNSAGNTVEGSVSRDVLDAKGRVVIPAGSPVAMRIAAIAPSKAGDSRGDGVLRLVVTSVTVHGAPHDLNVTLNNVPHTMKGRGVTKGVAEDLAVGTAIGAIAGQVIGKNTRSTVVGGAVGAVAGGAVAVAGAQRDVVVAPGTKIRFDLPRAMTIAAK